MKSIRPYKIDETSIFALKIMSSAITVKVATYKTDQYHEIMFILIRLVYSHDASPIFRKLFMSFPRSTSELEGKL